MRNRLSPHQLQESIAAVGASGSEEQATYALCSSFWNAKGPFSPKENGPFRSPGRLSGLLTG
jgi:hypothetical protein